MTQYLLFENRETLSRLECICYVILYILYYNSDCSYF